MRMVRKLISNFQKHPEVDINILHLILQFTAFAVILLASFATSAAAPCDAEKCTATKKHEAPVTESVALKAEATANESVNLEDQHQNTENQETPIQRTDRSSDSEVSTAELFTFSDPAQKDSQEVVATTEKAVPETDTTTLMTDENKTAKAEEEHQAAQNSLLKRTARFFHVPLYNYFDPQPDDYYYQNNAVNLQNFSKIQNAPLVYSSGNGNGPVSVTTGNATNN